VPESRWK